MYARVTSLAVGRPLTLAGFMQLPEYGPREPDNRVERFAFGGASEQLLAMGRRSGLTVCGAARWETEGSAFAAAREVVASTVAKAMKPQ